MTVRLAASSLLLKMGGGSQSWLVRCYDRERYIVKFQSNPQGSRVLVNEIIGTRLAQNLGLPTSHIAIVNVRENLIKRTPGAYIESSRGRVPCQHGPCFGSRLLLNPDGSLGITLQGVNSRPMPGKVSNLRDFLGMWIFDKWTGNADSRLVVF